MSSDEDTDRRLDTPGPVEGAPPKPRSLAGLLAAEYGLESPESPPAKPSRRRRIIGGAVVGAVGAIVLGAAGFSALAPTAGLATTDPSLGRLRQRFDSLVGELQARITSLTERLEVLSRPSTTTREERIASTAPVAARPARLVETPAPAGVADATANESVSASVRHAPVLTAPPVEVPHTWGMEALQTWGEPAALIERSGRGLSRAAYDSSASGRARSGSSSALAARSSVTEKPVSDHARAPEKPVGSPTGDLTASRVAANSGTARQDTADLMSVTEGPQLVAFEERPRMSKGSETISSIPIPTGTNRATDRIEAPKEVAKLVEIKAPEIVAPRPSNAGPATGKVTPDKGTNDKATSDKATSDKGTPDKGLSEVTTAKPEAALAKPDGKPDASSAKVDKSGPSGGVRSAPSILEKVFRKPDQVERIEPTGRTDKVDRIDKVDKVDKVEKIEKVEKVDKVDKVEKIEKVDKVEKVEKVSKIEKVEKVGRVEKPERVEKIEKVERVEKVELPVKVERVERQVKSEKPERIERKGK